MLEWAVKVSIDSLTDKNKVSALMVALEQDVGEKREIVKFFDNSLRQKMNNVWVAVDDLQVIGVIGWYQDRRSFIKKILGKLFPIGEKTYWVSFFAVSEKFRGKGVGTTLMEKLIKELKTKGARELWTYSRRARIFYEKMGFVWMAQKLVEGDKHDFLKYMFG